MFPLLPNWPLPFDPKEYTFPSFVSSNVWLSPADISTTFSIFILVGLYLFEVSPVPNCPELFTPQVHTVPSDFKATVYCVPLTIFGIAISFFLKTSTSIITFVVNLFVETSILVLPNFWPVTFPFASTDAIEESKLL